MLYFHDTCICRHGTILHQCQTMKEKTSIQYFQMHRQQVCITYYFHQQFNTYNCLTFFAGNYFLNTMKRSAEMFYIAALDPVLITELVYVSVSLSVSLPDLYLETVWYSLSLCINTRYNNMRKVTKPDLIWRNS